MHILCKQQLLFWMRLIVINRLTALIQNRISSTNISNNVNMIYNVWYKITPTMT